MPTQADLATTVLENLNVLAAGQSMSAEDKDVVLRRLPGVAANLNASLIAYIPDLDDIGDEFFLPLAAIVAYECCTAFGITGAKKQELFAESKRAEEKLRDVMRPRGTRQMLTVEPIGGRRYGLVRY